MTKTFVTHQGSHGEFVCSMTTWQLRENLIRAICSGKETKIKYGNQWKEVDFCDITEDNLNLIRVV